MIDTNEKLAGILVPVFALRSDHDLGIGDTQCIKEAIDFCARNNAAVLQVLPINETGGDNSPYSTISSVALDPVLLALTPDAVPGLTEHDYKEIVGRAPVGAGASQPSIPVNYPVVKKLKLDLLQAAFRNFANPDAFAAEKAQLAQFVKYEADWLLDYTLFRTLVAVHKGNASWPKW